MFLFRSKGNTIWGEFVARLDLMERHKHKSTFHCAVVKSRLGIGKGIRKADCIMLGIFVSSLRVRDQ